MKSSYGKTKPLTRSLECEWISKSPLPTNLFDAVNTPLPHSLDIDDSGWTIYVVWATLPSVLHYVIKIHPLGILPDSNTDYTSGHTRVFSQLHPPLLMNEHKHPFGINNPKFPIFFNTVLKLIFSIFRNNSYTSPFNLTGSKCIQFICKNRRQIHFVQCNHFITIC